MERQTAGTLKHDEVLYFERALQALARDPPGEPPRRPIGEAWRLRAPGLVQQWPKLMLAVVAFAILVVIAVRDLSPNTVSGSIVDFWSHPAEYFALHTIVASLVLAVLIFLMGWLILARRDEVRHRQIDEDITTVGLAGVVIALLSAAFVLRHLFEGELGHRYLAHHRRDGKPLKWVRGVLNGDDSDVTDHVGALGSPVERFAAEHPTSTPLHSLTNECLRKIVSALRDWADLLVFSDLGRVAMQSAYSLRVDLQELETALRSAAATADGCDADCPRGGDAFVQAYEKALFVAVACEFASRPVRPRAEVIAALAKHKGSAVTTTVGDRATDLRQRAAVRWLMFASDQRALQPPRSIILCPGGCSRANVAGAARGRS